jgi:hypothetical protein
LPQAEEEVEEEVAMYKIDESVENGKIKYTVIWTGAIPSDPHVFSPMCVCPARPQAEEIVKCLNADYLYRHF